MIKYKKFFLFLVLFSLNHCKNLSACAMALYEAAPAPRIAQVPLCEASVWHAKMNEANSRLGVKERQFSKMRSQSITKMFDFISNSHDQQAFICLPQGKNNVVAYACDLDDRYRSKYSISAEHLVGSTIEKTRNKVGDAYRWVKSYSHNSLLVIDNVDILFDPTKVSPDIASVVYDQFEKESCECGRGNGIAKIVYIVRDVSKIDQKFIDLFAKDDLIITFDSFNEHKEYLLKEFSRTSKPVLNWDIIHAHINEFKTIARAGDHTIMNPLLEEIEKDMPIVEQELNKLNNDLFDYDMEAASLISSKHQNIEKHLNELDAYIHSPAFTLGLRTIAAGKFSSLSRYIKSYLIGVDNCLLTHYQMPPQQALNNIIEKTKTLDVDLWPNILKDMYESSQRKNGCLTQEIIDQELEKIERIQLERNEKPTEHFQNILKHIHDKDIEVPSPAVIVTQEPATPIAEPIAVEAPATIQEIDVVPDVPANIDQNLEKSDAEPIPTMAPTPLSQFPGLSWWKENPKYLGLSGIVSLIFIYREKISKLFKKDDKQEADGSEVTA